MRRCNLADDGTVNAYYDGVGYVEDGSNGQVMVEIPRFYYKTVVTADGYEWYVSPLPLTGYKVHPAFVRDGTTIGHVYIGAYEASAYDVTAEATEVNTVTVTHEATASGNITIKLEGNKTITVAVTEGDTAAQVAAKLRAATYLDNGGLTWTVGGADAVMTLTRPSAGLASTAVFGGGTTGVTASVAKSVSGAGGYTLNDPAGLDLTATTGDKLASISGVKPISGLRNTLTLVNSRVLAHNRGAGWEVNDFLTICAVQLLMLVEYASFDSQTTIGSGVSSLTDDGATNMAVYTGQTAALGNASGAATGQTHYQTGQAANSVSYRGIENMWGNIWSWVDGINIKADRNPWMADHGFACDTFALPYVDSGLTLHIANGYGADIAIDSDNDYQFLPSAVSASNVKLCDYYYPAVGDRSAMLGGRWSGGVACGARYWNLSNSGVSSFGQSVGARLLYVGGA